MGQFAGFSASSHAADIPQTGVIPFCYGRVRPRENSAGSHPVDAISSARKGDHEDYTGEKLMNLYAILRRGGFADGQRLEAAAARSTKVGDEMAGDIRWIRSYVLGEEDGALGTVCIYQASSPDAIRKHADAADLPISEIVPIANTVIVRPDPE